MPTFKQIYTNPAVITLAAIVVVALIIMWLNRDKNGANGDSSDRVSAECMEGCKGRGKSRAWCLELCSSSTRVSNTPSYVVNQGTPVNPTGTVGGLGGVIGTGTPVGGFGGGGGGPRPGAVA